MYPGQSRDASPTKGREVGIFTVFRYIFSLKGIALHPDPGNSKNMFLKVEARINERIHLIPDTQPKIT